VEYEMFFIPIIIGPTEIVTEGLQISGNNTRIAFSRFANYRKQTAVLGTSYIMRKVLPSET
jgi:hypothetical protein